MVFCSTTIGEDQCFRIYSNGELNLHTDTPITRLLLNSIRQGNLRQQGPMQRGHRTRRASYRKQISSTIWKSRYYFVAEEVKLNKEGSRL